jgi:hypothetical protein
MTNIAPDDPTADEIFGRRLAPAPWQSSRVVLALVIEELPMIEDDLKVDLLEHLALTLADREEEGVSRRG